MRRLTVVLALDEALIVGLGVLGIIGTGQDVEVA